MAQRSGASILQRFEALPIIVVFVLLLLLFMYKAPEVFLAPYIYTTFLSTLPPLVLLATGLTFVIGAGEIDLSFPSIIAFSGFVFAVLFKEYDLGWIAVVAGLASGILVGFVNGIIIAKVGIPSFMTTLGTQFFWAGIATVLSGGERQGIAIGRAMHYNADLIVLDEPTAALGVAEVRKVVEFVRRIKQSGRACIYIEHNLAHVHEVADRLVVLDRGRVVSEISPKDMTVPELTEYLIALQHKA